MSHTEKPDLNGEELPFLTDYPKPWKLDDIYDEIPDDALASILSKAPGDLTGHEIWMIFQGGLSTISFEQGMYYLPWAIRYLRNDDSDQSFFSNVYDGINHFIRDHLDSSDQNCPIFSMIESAYRQYLFEFWTSRFEFLTREYPFQIKYSSNVSSILFNDPIYPSPFPHLAQECVSALAKTRDQPVTSAWFLEILRKYSYGQICGILDIVAPLSHK